MKPENLNIRKARTGNSSDNDDQETLEWKPKKQGMNSNNKGASLFEFRKLNILL